MPRMGAEVHDLTNADVDDGRSSVDASAAPVKDLRTDLQRQFGSKVRELREARGWTQARLGQRVAEVVGHEGPDRPAPFWTQVAAISRLERGVLVVPLELVEVLARAFDEDPLLLIEPVFRRAPRSAEEIERQRVRDFISSLADLYDRFEAEYGDLLRDRLLTRALEALTVMAKNDVADAQAAIRTLEGLVLRQTQARDKPLMEQLDDLAKVPSG